MIGKTLGHYQIASQLGKGGMGEVYQAKDRKLGRDVAIKVLPEEFARDADRVARFQREAKLLASLNHPNIAAIYGLEESEGTNFLVLELVEGETLADRIKAGPVPVEEALKLALQIAEALEAAHEKGVIHRDLKPPNIKVTPNGKVKVLDFGLAKAFAGEQAELNLSNSPTLSNAATQQGVILGTAAYMSPEQARGKAVDKRGDIWAFGCVLYEMLTGQAAFQGEDITEILASVVKGGANLDLLPANLHPRVREVITRCLQKDLRRRYSSITDTRYEIDQALADPSGILVMPLAATKRQSKLWLILPWVATAVVLASIIAGVAVWKLKPVLPPEPRQVTRLYYELPRDQRFVSLLDHALAVSPDGRQLVYSTTSGLYIRAMEELDAKLIAGTGGAQNPFFSPDGKWIGYYSGTDRQLKKISISGGAPLNVTDTSDPMGFIYWSVDDTIVYCQAGIGIMRVSANGGKPEAIIKEEKLIFAHPQILPDGKSVLFTNISSQPSKVMLQSLQSGERKELFAGDMARYLSTGHIVYGLGNNLLAVPFDLKALKVAGGPISVLEGVLQARGPSQYAVSDSGTLVYVPESAFASQSPQRTLVWVDRNGKEESLATPPNGYQNPRISPEGTRVALAVNAGGHTDIWIWDLVRKTLARLTFDAYQDSSSLWTPDGKRIAFNVHRGSFGVYWKAADGTGKDEILGLPTSTQINPASWSRDGKTLVADAYPSMAVFASLDIAILSLEGERKWRPLLKEKYSEAQPQISPDGRWMAYTSNESGKNEVYVRPFPDVDKGRWQVSTAGGDSPLWSQNGRELFYRSGDAVMTVSLRTDPTFSLEAPKVLFRGAYVPSSFGAPSPDLRPWDVSSDGKRFLMIKEAGSNTAAGEDPRRINIVLNWLEELKQRVPVK